MQGEVTPLLTPHRSSCSSNTSAFVHDRLRTSAQDIILFVFIRVLYIAHCVYESGLH